MATADTYKRGIRSGASRQDEKDADAYAKNEIKRSKSAGFPKSVVASRGRTANKNYLDNMRTEKGRSVNKSNVQTMKDDLSPKKTPSPAAKRLANKSI